MALVGERKALAAAVMAFFTCIFVMNGLLGMPELAPLFLGLGAIYGVAFFGLVAGWFWARWYASGIAASGGAMAVMLAFQIGLDPIVFFWGGTHVVALVCLMGTGAAAAFDARADWRERWRMDDAAASRLGKAVQRAGASLPYLVMAGLAPKQGMAMLIGLGALALGAVGLRALVRMRSWGVLALGGAAALAVLAATSAPAGQAFSLCGVGCGGVLTTGAALTVWSAAPLASVIAAVALVAAVVPFIRPALRYLRE